VAYFKQIARCVNVILY